MASGILVASYWKAYAKQYSNLVDFVDPVVKNPRWSQTVVGTGLFLDVFVAALNLLSFGSKHHPTYDDSILHILILCAQYLLASFMMIYYIYVAVLVRQTVASTTSLKTMSIYLFFASFFTACVLVSFSIVATGTWLKSEHFFAAAVFLGYFGRAGLSLCNVSVLSGKTSFLTNEDGRIADLLREREEALTLTKREEQEASFEKKIDQELHKQEKDFVARELEMSQRGKDFLASALHEIRNPLNGIVLALKYIFCELELSLVKVPDVKEEICTIDSCANHLQTLLHSILSLDKMLNGTLPVPKEMFKPAQLMYEIERMNKHAAEEGIQVAFEGSGREDDEACTTLEGAPTQLKLVLLNLVGNAIKFTHRGKIRLSWKKEEETEKDMVVKFSVEDTGVGIPADQRESIFAFRKQIGEIEAQTKGFGIGLSVAFKLVQMMGGELKVRSPVREADADGGVGSEFYFNLRLKKREVQAIQRKRTFSEVEELQNFRVLVVDDAFVNRKLTSRLFTAGKFKELKWTANVAKTGEQALEMIEAGTEGRRYDLVIMDEDMEEGGGTLKGTDATRVIRRRERERGITGRERSLVFGFSGTDTEEQREKSKESGQDMFWCKPICQKDDEIIEELAQAKLKQMESRNEWGLDELNISRTDYVSGISSGGSEEKEGRGRLPGTVECTPEEAHRPVTALD